MLELFVKKTEYKEDETDANKDLRMPMCCLSGAQ
jgi:hypothetical protein